MGRGAELGAPGSCKPPHPPHRGHSRLFLPFEPLQVHFWKMGAVPMLEKSPLVLGGEARGAAEEGIEGWCRERVTWMGAATGNTGGGRAVLGCFPNVPGLVVPLSCVDWGEQPSSPPNKLGASSTAPPGVKQPLGMEKGARTLVPTSPAPSSSQYHRGPAAAPPILGARETAALCGFCPVFNTLCFQQAGPCPPTPPPCGSAQRGNLASVRRSHQS